MWTRNRPMIVPGVCGLAFLLGAIGPVWADDAKPAYPVMAPIEQYRVASASEEIALSRSAAPISISGDASVLTLGEHGYETALKGKNGFVCLVQRSWAAGFGDAELLALPADAVFGVFEEDAGVEELVADGVGAGEVALLFGLGALGD